MDVTACTTVVSRWEKLDNCLQALFSGNQQPDEVIVLDNSNTPGANPVLEKHDVSVIEVEEKIGPSEARKRLSDSVETPLTLFIDADVSANSQALERLHSRLTNTEYSVAAGIWSDYNKFYRRVGNSLHFDPVERNVIKKPISYGDVQDFETVEVEFSTPQVMLETQVLDQVGFDPEYRFYFEWWDFFMQLREIEEPILTVLDAEFIHEPGGYKGNESTRHDNYDPKIDQQYFEEKWGYTPKTLDIEDGTYSKSQLKRRASHYLKLLDVAQKRKL
ncbi:glycosyltransferase family 2 protein [Halorientalis halophila]|uniref:glycosyltransferase family 2 protein n=1 Tax=Halorientalis halophila TaxID=3108499 RepID=UPI0030092F90